MRITKSSHLVVFVIKVVVSIELRGSFLFSPQGFYLLGILYRFFSFKSAISLVGDLFKSNVTLIIGVHSLKDHLVIFFLNFANKFGCRIKADQAYGNVVSIVEE